MQKYKFFYIYANNSAEKAFSAPFETNKNEKGISCKSRYGNFCYLCKRKFITNLMIKTN